MGEGRIPNQTAADLRLAQEVAARLVFIGAEGGAGKSPIKINGNGDAYAT